MNLNELISSLDDLPDEGFIFAHAEDGRFCRELDAVVLELSDEELDRPTEVVASERAPGLSYFLEVDIAREVLEDLKKAPPEFRQRYPDPTAAVIHYAEYDAL
jgi:hypothetical protein